MLLPAFALCLLTQTALQTPDTPPHSYRVPYRLTETQHLMVRAKINGKGPYNFLIDTGAPAVFLTPSIAKTLGVKSDMTGWGKFETLEIEGGAVQKNVPVRIEEVFQMQGMNAMGLAGSRIDGIFGFTLLSQYKQDIDLSETALIWTPTPFDAMAFLTASMGRAMKTKPPKQASADMEAMQQLSKLASSLFARSQKETVRRAFFGVEIADAKNGVQVTTVLAESPAAIAGLQAGDRITHIQRDKETEIVPVTSVATLRAALAEVTPDQPVVFTVWRGTVKSRLTVIGKEGL